MIRMNLDSSGRIFCVSMIFPSHHRNGGLSEVISLVRGNTTVTVFASIDEPIENYLY